MDSLLSDEEKTGR